LWFPPALLEPFEQKWAEQVLILLARNKDNEEPLLRLRANNPVDMVWLGANNLLFGKKSLRCYRATLREISDDAISITHRFTVADTDRPATGGILGGFNSCGVWGIAQMPQGFPPGALYHLCAVSGSGTVLLARGPRSVYYERIIVPTDKGGGHRRLSPAA
jgi:hypothetical protein